MSAASAPRTRQRLSSGLARARNRTFAMTEPLTDDDLHLQFDPLMSPLVWDMGHIANFEEYWLLRELDGRTAHDAERVRIDGGSFMMGTDNRTAAYDNERPAHSVHVEAFDLDRFPVTNRRFAVFIDAGRYDRSEFWSRPSLGQLVDGHRASIRPCAGPQGLTPCDVAPLRARRSNTQAVQVPMAVQHQGPGPHQRAAARRRRGEFLPRHVPSRSRCGSSSRHC